MESVAGAALLAMYLTISPTIQNPSHTIIPSRKKKQRVLNEFSKPSSAFRYAKGSSPVFYLKADPKFDFRENPELSTLDVAKINYFYECTKKKEK